MWTLHYMAWGNSPNSEGRAITGRIMARVTRPHPSIEQTVVPPTPVTAVAVTLLLCVNCDSVSLLKARHHLLVRVWSGLDGLGYTEGTHLYESHPARRQPSKKARMHTQK